MSATEIISAFVLAFAAFLWLQVKLGEWTERERERNGNENSRDAK